MATVLEEICAKTRLHVETSKARTTLHDLQKQIQNTEKPRGFLNALRERSLSGAPAMITEVKKASPSKGLIRADFDPATIAKTYEDYGASCISVLTDEPYFQGHDDYLIAVKNTVKLPVLRKDFMIDEYQIYQSRALGADCILLIMACLTDNQAKDFYTLAKQLSMDVLVEIHDEEELTRALKLSPEMIGINNRNLKTLSVDVKTSFNLVEKIPAPCLKISESGLSDYATIKHLQSVGFSAFLVGESLMRQAEIGPALQTLIGNSV